MPLSTIRAALCTLTAVLPLLFSQNSINCSSIINCKVDAFDEEIALAHQNPMIHEDGQQRHLTEASLIVLQNTFSDKSSNASIDELLRFKRSSSFKSTNGEDELFIGKSPSKASSFSLLLPLLPVINNSDDAPTESLSLTSSSGPESARLPPLAQPLPATIRDFAEYEDILKSLVEFIEPEDWDAVSSAGIDIFDSFMKKYFSKTFPSLDKISNWPGLLKELEMALSRMPLKIEASQPSSHTSDADPFSVLMAYISNYLSRPSQALSERYALANLIELIRLQSGKFLGYDSSYSLPSPLQVLFPEISVFNDFTSISKPKLISVVMQICNQGHLPMMVALIRDIKERFAKTGASIILECFLLAKESRSGINWSPLQRTVHSSSLPVARYIFNDLASDQAVLEAFRIHLFATKNKEISSQLPSPLERLLFPTMSAFNTAQLLRKTILNFIAVGRLRSLHIIACKTSNSSYLAQFLSWDRQINGPFSSQDLFLLLDATFASKSPNLTLKVMKKIVEMDDVEKRFRFPLNLAIKYDQPSALMIYLGPEITAHRLRSRLLNNSENLLDAISRHDSHKFLKFVLEDLFKIEKDEIKSILPFPLKTAIDNESWNVLRIFLEEDSESYGKLGRQELMNILKKQADLLDLIFRDELIRIEIFARTFIEDSNHVSIIEWVILTGNQIAFDWFLKQKLSLKFWRQFDGAGNAPIHLALIVGNSNFICKLLQIDPSLATQPNYFGETPLDLAKRLRDKTMDLIKIGLIEEILVILRKFGTQNLETNKQISKS